MIEGPIFYLLVIIIGSWFLLNLVLAVIMDSFEKVDREMAMEEFKKEIEDVEGQVKQPIPEKSPLPVQSEESSLREESFDEDWNPKSRADATPKESDFRIKMKSIGTEEEYEESKDEDSSKEPSLVMVPRETHKDVWEGIPEVQKSPRMIGKMWSHEEESKIDEGEKDISPFDDEEEDEEHKVDTPLEVAPEPILEVKSALIEHIVTYNTE